MKLIFILVVCLGIWNTNGLPTKEEKSPQTALDQDSDQDSDLLHARSGEIIYRSKGGLSYSDREKIKDIARDGLQMYGTDANAMRKHFIKRMRSDYGSHKWVCLNAMTMGYSYDGGYSKAFLLGMDGMEIFCITVG